jgi:hypothetical protein
MVIESKPKLYQYINLKLRSKVCWACLEQLTGIVPNAYRYHAECLFKLQSKSEDINGERRKPR